MSSPVVLTPMRIEAAAVRWGLRGHPRAEVVVTGMGPRRSEASAARLGLGPEAGAVAVMGFAGGLTADVAPGDVVVATEVRGPDGATTALTSAATAAGALRRSGLRVHTGPVVSLAHVVRGPERAGLAASGAVAVDTESAWLVPAVSAPARTAGGPVVVVRAVVDTPAAELLSPATPVAGIRAWRSLARAAGVLETWAAAALPAGEVRQVLLAGPRSFCAGVERAIEIVERGLERFGPPVYVRRQIVHNAHVVAGLEARGAVFVEELDEVPEGATVVFSAHGVSQAVRRQAEERELHVIDATCPLVAKVHTETRRFSRKGYQILLIGHAGHEEVEGTLGEAPGVIQLVGSPEDVDRVQVEDPSRVAYLTQTTLATDEVDGVVDRLRDRFPELVGPSATDICYATQNRQDGVRAVASSCDVLLVVGSRNSSNSNRLVEVAERQGCPAHLIDDASELDLAWLAGARTVGLTAGASAPESMVTGVIEALGTLGPISVSEHPVTTESIHFPLPTEVR